MGVRLLLLQGALQAMTPPDLWMHPAVAASAAAPGSSPAPRCSSSGSARISAASPQARAATAPYTCTLGGERGRERGGAEYFINPSCCSCHITLITTTT